MEKVEAIRGRRKITEMSSHAIPQGGAGHAAVQELEKAGITDDETLNRVQVAILCHSSDSVSPPDPLPRGAVIR